jgi:hypothetical protein
VVDGAALLDRIARSDWRDRVDLDRLDMGDSEACVAAQVFGNWWDVGSEVRRHDAFGGDLDRREEEDAGMLDALRAAWVELLTP